MEVRGGIVVNSTGCPSTCVVTQVQFQVANAAGGDPIPLDPTATNNRTVIAYRDAVVVDNDMTYTVTWITGNSDTLLEPGELATITITAASNANTIEDLAANDRWTLELQTPVGAIVDITRSMPAQLQTVMQLH
jgi:archaellin